MFARLLTSRFKYTAFAPAETAAPANATATQDNA